jgi:hypothetical protein
MGAHPPRLLDAEGGQLRIPLPLETPCVVEFGLAVSNEIDHLHRAGLPGVDGNDYLIA